MAITKQDCFLLLTELQTSNENIDCSLLINDQLKESQPTIEALKFINQHRQLDVTQFYEKLRRSYNSKKSKLYINIVREKLNSPKDVLTTLAALSLQILLYSENLDNPTLFLKHSRFKEVTKCLYNYSKTFDLIPCLKLLQLIKADLKVLEFSNGRDTESALYK